MGEYLAVHGKTKDSVVLAAYEHDVPIFCPAFSDCSAGFGLVAHQHAKGDAPKVSLDSAKDFYELTQLKIKNPATGIFMLGGGVPLAALVATEAVSCFSHGDQGGTFNGNPLMAAVGCAILDAVLAPGFLGGVQARGRQLSESLAALSSRSPR